MLCTDRTEQTSKRSLQRLVPAAWGQTVRLLSRISVHYGSPWPTAHGPRPTEVLINTHEQFRLQAPHLALLLCRLPASACLVTLLGCCESAHVCCGVRAVQRETRNKQKVDADGEAKNGFDSSPAALNQHRPLPPRDITTCTALHPMHPTRLGSVTTSMASPWTCHAPSKPPSVTATGSPVANTMLTPDFGPQARA